MKNILIVFGTMLLSQMVSAQVKFNLGYQEDTKVYTLSVLPETTWESPKNMLNSAQIVLRVDAGKEFIPAITPLVEGLIWADNAYIDQPPGAEDFTFVCISLVNGPTQKITMVEGEELPLFSFVNAGAGCPGKVTLATNDDPSVVAARSAGFNVTQHFGMLGARGNAFTGVVNGEVDCTPVSGTQEPEVKVVDDVKIAPLPADKSATISWTLLSDQHALRHIVICDVVGREVFREKISESKGPQSLSVNVENWQAGMYRVRFLLSENQQTQSWNLLVIH